mmetsp:Transcript_61158/g.145667  ORF Transcript_61158/g.145667 Transcript_61158/m.145667 type:complete len:159 (-) Transcript_61158:148-624(-)|eukprot:CAMPEP_0178404808 /NCGR_PEP_ID=MMETSP0689_2-20121128/18079_1 /TAXON_ID=160604 /ORGANISM="Amphidinium massartii, Strain CS-259" /LENGTH=158 /DNA_ID=CAMNT_0020025813 /DNA_START=107 /DNA_END=583 /DNA_ORIENTATION=-
MPAKIVVPSDITILEEKHKIGRRRVRILEKLGMLGMAPMFHLHYSKMDPSDMRAVLMKKYDPDDKSAVVEILKTRQEAISKQVKSHNFMWGTAGLMTGLTYWSFRRYNYQSRLIAVPMIFYAGTWVGRFVGDIVTGRNAEFGRDRYLASLPAKVYLPA